MTCPIPPQAAVRTARRGPAPSRCRRLTRTPRMLAALAVLLFGATACSEGESPTDPGTNPNPGDTATTGTPVSASDLSPLTDWPEPPADVLPTPVPNSAVVEQVTVDSVSTVAEDGTRTWSDGPVDYICTTETYTLANTPEKLVMFSGAPRDVLWPGALIQGRTHSDTRVDPQGNPVASLVGLSIPERAPIQISINDLPTGNNERTVEVVTQPNVDAARGEMIGDAAARELFTPASDDFEVETYSSEREFALRTGLSGRYLRFRANASGSVDRTASETTIAVRYIQRLYEVTVAQPPGPDAFFTDDFTRERLQEEIGRGTMGPDNQPLYVASVVYGRMMMFTLTAEATAEELTRIVNLSYSGVVGGVEASLSARESEIVSRSKVSITTYGGGRTGSQDMIRSGDWREYFTQDVRLEEALPLSYKFRTLDGEEAGVQEATTYEAQNCQPLGNTPLTYPRDGMGQDIGAVVPTPFDSYLADVTGDRIHDLVLNYLSPGQNLAAVLPGTASGEFASAVVTDLGAAPPGGWANFNLLLGDVDGDEDADLVWSRAGRKAQADTNYVYVGLGEADGSLALQPQQRHPGTNWSTAYRPLLADLNGDRKKDLAWNTLGGSNFTWVALATDGGAFVFDSIPLAQNSRFGGDSYEPFVGDVDRDGDDDLIWNSVRSNEPNRTYVGRLRTDLAFDFPAGNDHPGICCWLNYQRVVGDFDGDLQSDILFWNPSGRAAHRAYANGFDSWSFPAFQRLGEIPSSNAWRTYAGDLNGDGVDDMIVNRLDGENSVWAAYGQRSRTFDEPFFNPPHPAGETWTTVPGMLVGDVTGEGRDDVVWVVPGSTIRVYTGLGRS